ncbi:hypothetical protein LCGC14_1875760, partial [marine sediment metagenome]
ERTVSGAIVFSPGSERDRVAGEDRGRAGAIRGGTDQDRILLRLYHGISLLTLLDQVSRQRREHERSPCRFMLLVREPL